VHVAKRRGQVLVEDPHHLLGRDAVGDGAADERAGAGADVDVEVVDRAVDREQVEGAEGADLVDRTRRPAPAEDERRLRSAAPAAAGLLGAARRVELDYLAHRHSQLWQRQHPDRTVATAECPGFHVASAGSPRTGGCTGIYTRALGCPLAPSSRHCSPLPRSSPLPPPPPPPRRRPAGRRCRVPISPSAAIPPPPAPSADRSAVASCAASSTGATRPPPARDADR